MTITQTISQFTLPVPNRNTQTPVEFSDSVDTFLSEINDYVTEVNTWSSQANGLATTMNGYAADALASENAAAASEAAAAAYANATAYSPSATYDYPDAVIGSDGFTYTCVDTGVTGDDPVGSVTGDWVMTSVRAPDVLTKTSNYNITTTDCAGQRTISSGGATGALNHTLPTGAEGYKISFYIAEDYELEVNASNSEKIRYSSTLSIANGGIRTKTDLHRGTFFTLEFIDNEWQVIRFTQPLEIETS